MSAGRTIVYVPAAAREFDALDPVIRGRIESALASLALDPLALHNQIKRLKGDPALRLRVGDWRIIFDALPDEIVVLAVGIAGKSTEERPEVNQRVQIIVTPAGERLAILPEADYLLLLAASEDDEGEARPEFLREVRRRREAFAQVRANDAKDANSAG